MRAATRALLLVLLASPLPADEGMWLFNAFPADRVQAEYGFTPDKAWFDHVQLSSLKFGGGSGSFVSPEGLAITNHHVVRSCISNLSSKEHDYMNEGFVAATRADEKTCPGVEISRLLGIERVTARVRGVEKPEMSPAEAEAARKKEMAAIEKACSDGDAVRCDVVTLYSGQVVFRRVERLKAPVEHVAGQHTIPPNGIGCRNSSYLRRMRRVTVPTRSSTSRTRVSFRITP